MQSPTLEFGQDTEVNIFVPGKSSNGLSVPIRALRSKTNFLLTSEEEDSAIQIGKLA